VYTAHNLEYQGIFGQRVLEIAGLGDFGFIVHPELGADLNTAVDLAARGLLFADIINTVSETHAREILTPEYGHRLDHLTAATAPGIGTALTPISAGDRRESNSPFYLSALSAVRRSATGSDDVDPASRWWASCRVRIRRAWTSSRTL
jgi:hypothetical protein